MSGQSLHDFVEEVSGESHLRVEHDFGGGFVRLQTSEAERRQAAQDIQCSENILLELLRNSLDAHSAHAFVATSKEGDVRVLTVIDDGDGVPKSMHKHVFEPRVTSKLDTSHMDAWGLHGRGMALYSISVNALKAQIADSDEGLGCSVRITSDTTRLREKKDQSSFPTFHLDDEGVVSVRGPRNLLRTACEFSIEARGRCAIYMGSPAEIAATLRAYGESTLSAVERVFCSSPDTVPLAKRLATASDASDLQNLCSTMGLEMSERTARRILDGQIPVLDPLLDRVVIEHATAKKSGKGSKSSPRAPIVRFERDELETLAKAAGKAYAEIAERYYLDGSVMPVARVYKDSITVTIPIAALED